MQFLNFLFKKFDFFQTLKNKKLMVELLPYFTLSHILSIFNPQTFSVNEKISIKTNQNSTKVEFLNGTSIVSQILPILNIDEYMFEEEYFNLVFYVNLKPLGSTKVKVTFVEVNLGKEKSTGVISKVYTNSKVG